MIARKNKKRWPGSVTSALVSLAFFATAFVATPVPSFALTCISRASGNWNAPATWGACGTGSPGAADTVLLSTHNVTVNVSTTIAALNFTGGNTNSVLTMSNSSMTVTGNVTMNQPNTTGITNGWNINSSTVIINGFLISTNSSALNRTSTITISIGVMTVSTLTFAGTTPTNIVLNMSGGAGQLNILNAINFSTSATLSAGTSSIVNFRGTQNQTISAAWGGGGYNELWIKPTVAGTTKTFGPGTIRMSDLEVGDGTNAVTLTNAPNNAVIYSSGNVILNLGATFTKGTSSMTFKPSGTMTWTDNNATKQDMGWVKIEGGRATPRINLGSSVKVSTMAIAAAHELNANGSNTLELTSAGTPFSNLGTFTYSTGIVRYTGNGATNISAFAGSAGTNGYYDLEIKPAGATSHTLGTAASQTIRINNNLTIGDGANAGGATGSTNNPVVLVSSGVLINAAATFTAANSSMTVGGNWVNNSTFTQNSSTVIFNGAMQTTFSGSTTFYVMRAATSGTTLYFTAGSTNYVTTILDLENISLRSTNNTTWYFVFSGSSQTLLNVDVKDSNANQGRTLFPDAASDDTGNNRNWAFGDRRYWVASGASNWGSTASWSYSSAGKTGAPVPTSTHTVVFDGTGGTNGQANVDVAVTISSLTISSGYTGTLNTQGYNITVASNVSQANGTITMTTNTLTIGGDLIRGGGTFNAAASTITLNGAGNQSINSGNASLFTLNVNKSGGTASLVQALNLNGNLTMNAGTLDTGSNWVINVTSHVNLAGGTLQLNGSTMSVQRDWTKTGGAFVAGTSTVNFIGGNAQTLTPGGTDFFNFVSSKTAGTNLTLSGGLGIDGDWSQLNGTFLSQNNWVAIAGSANLSLGTWTLGTSTVTVGGNFTETSTTFNANQSTIVFNGSGGQSINPNGINFYNVHINKPSGTLAFAGALFVGNDWTNSTTPDIGTGSTVTFNSATVQKISGDTTFYALRAITTNATLQFAVGTTQYVRNMVEFRNISLFSPTNGSKWMFAYKGSSQTIVTVRVRDSDASPGAGTVMTADATSRSFGNNTNWAFPQAADTGVRYWVAPAAGLWNDSGNWSNSSGGNGGAQVPLATHTVVFDGVGGANGQANINVSVTIASLTISGYTGIFNTNGYDLMVASNVTQTSGSLLLSTSQVTFKGDLLRTGGSFDAGASTITISGTQNQTLVPNSTNFAYVSINKSGGTLSLVGSLFVTNDWTNTTTPNIGATSTVTFAGTSLQKISGNTTFYVLRAITANATVQFAAGSTQYVTNTLEFRNVGLFSPTNGATWYFSYKGSSQTVVNVNVRDSNASPGAGGVMAADNTSGNFGNNTNWSFAQGADSGVRYWVALSAGQWNSSANWSNTAGGPGGAQVPLATHTVVFDGNSVSNANFASNVTISSLTIAGFSGLIDTNGYAFTVSSNVTQTSGSLVFGTSQVTLNGDLLRAGGAFDAGNSTITISGSQNQTLTPNTTSFANVVINKTAGTLTVSGALIVTGDWKNTTTPNIGSVSTVTFAGPTIQTLSGSTTFYGWRAITPGATLFFAAGTTQYATSMVEFRDIDLRSTNNTTWYFAFGGSSQTLVNLDVKDSNANLGVALFPDAQSVDSGNNKNWAFGDRRYWAATGTNNWNATTSWSYSSGGKTGAPVPTSTHTVVFDGAGGTNGQANVNNVLNISSLTIAGYTGLINTQGYDITVASNVTQVSGTLTMTTNTLTIGGDMIRSGGTFNTAASTLTLNGATNQSLNNGNATLFTLNINKSGGTASLVQTLNLNGSLLLTNGTLDTTPSNWAVNVTSHVSITGGTLQLNASTMSVQRDWVKTGGFFSAGTSTVSFIGGNAQILTSGGTDFYHLVSSKTAGTTLAVNGNLGVDGDLNFLNGTMNTQGYTITVASDVFLTNGTINMTTNTFFVGGDFARTATTFNSVLSTVSFNGIVDQSVSPNGLTFYSVQINKSGSTTATLMSPLTTNGDLRITAGTLDTGTNWSVTVASHVAITNTGAFNINNSTMSLQRDWTNTSALVNPGFSTVTLLGGFAQSITSSGDNFFGLQVNKTVATTATLQDTLDVDGIFTITAGSITTNGRSVTVGGNWDNSGAGTFSGMNSTVTLNSATSQTILGQTTFYSLSAITTGSTIYFAAGSTNNITNILEFRNNSLRSSSNGLFWYLRMMGSSQTVVSVNVQDSNAYVGNTILPTTSIDSGNNRNWAFGDDRYWVASAPGNWSSTANWSRSSGGTGGASVPSSTHTVIFDGFNAKNGQANIDVAVNISSLTISGYAGTINSQGYNITVTSNITQVSGALTMTTNTLTLGGDFIRTGGTFNTAASTLTLNGTLNQSLNVGNATLFTLNVNKTNGTTASLVQALNLNGSLVVNNGTIDTTPSNWAINVTSFVNIVGGTLQLNASTMSVQRDWVKTGGFFSAGASTVSFIGGNAQILTSGGTDFYHLVSSKTAGTTLAVNGNLGVDGDLNFLNGTMNTQGFSITVASNVFLTNGTINMTTNTMFVGGNFTRTAATFNSVLSTVAFNGSIDQSINSNGLTFYHVQINKSGGTTATLTSALTTNGDLKISAGTLDTGSNWSVTVASHVAITNTGAFNLNNSTMSLQRDWTNTSALVNPGLSTVTFIGGFAQNVTSSGDNFFNFQINKTANTVATLQDTFDADGSFTITAGTISAIGKSLTIGGNWNNAGTGTYTGTNSSVTFNSATSQTILGQTTFYSLHAIMPGSTLYFSAGSTNSVTGIVEFRDVFLRSTTNNATWYFKYNGSSQTIVDTTVQDSNANFGTTLFPDPASTNSGNNRNWAFGGINTRYWVSSGAANWNAIANWSYASGSAGGAPLPASTDTVVFDGANNSNGQANVNVTVNIASLTIAGYIGTINTQGFGITVTSNVTQQSGTITMTTNTLTLGGDLIRSSGTFNTAQSTLTLNGTVDQSINSGNASLYTLNVNKANGTTATLAQALNLNGSLVMNNGTLDTGAGWAINVSSFVNIAGGTLQLNSSTVSVQRNWVKTGGFFSAGTSTVSFIGGNAQILTSGGTDFYHLVSSKTAGTTLAVNGNLGVDGDLNFLNGTMNTQGFSITVASNVFLTNGIINMTTNTFFVGGNFSRASTTFNANRSTVAFNGFVDQSINPNGLTFYTVNLNKSGGTTATLVSPLTTNGDLAISAGTLDTGSNWSVTVASFVAITNTGAFNLNNSTMSLQRDWTNTSALVNPGLSTVTFIGGFAQNVTSSGDNFFNLQINKTLATIATLQDSLDVDGIFTISAGSISANGRAITVGGNWDNSGAGTFSSMNSTVTFNGATSQTILGQTTFYSLRAINPGATLYFTAGSTANVTNILEFRDNNLRSTTNGLFWYLRMIGSSQSVVNVNVQDSNAYGGNTIVPVTSADSGNNRNWAFGDDRYWVASAPGNWNTPANWSRTSGGTGGASVPSSTHTVIFDGVNNKNGQANVNVLVNIASLTISGYSGTINTQGYNVTVTSNITQVSGTLTMTTNTLTLGGDFIRTGGTFNTAASTLTLNGTLNQSLNVGNATLFTLNVNKTNGTTASLVQALNLNGSLVVNSGTIDTTPSNWAVNVTSHVTLTGGVLQLNGSTMSVQRDWTNTGGTFSAGTSTVSFIGGNAQILTSGGTDFYHLVSSKTAGTTLAVNGNLGVDGDLNFMNGTMNTQGFSITVASNVFLTNGIINMTTNTFFVGGNFSRAATTFNANRSTVAFNGFIDQSINPNGLIFYTVNLNKSGGTTATLVSPLTTNGDLAISAGTLDTGSNWSVTVASFVAITNTGAFNLNSSTMSLQRDWTNTSALVNPGLSTVTFIGGFAQSITSNGDNFFGCQINKNVNTVATLQDAFDVDGIFTIAGGTINTNGKALVIGGNWNNSLGATYTGTNSTVTFNGATSQAILGQTTFYSLRAITNGSTLYFTAGSTNHVTGIVEFRDVSLRSTTDNATWYFKYTGSSQTIIDVTVQDSNANFGSTLFADTQSSNAGNNRNWVFGTSGTRYWVSAAPANWNSTASWSYASGGSSGASVPVSSETVVFDGANGFNGQANVNVSVNIASLTIAGYAGTINSQGYDITVASNVTQTSGGIALSTSQVTFNGDLIRSGGRFDAATSTITISGNQNQTLTPNATAFAHVVINKTGGTLDLVGSLVVTGNWTNSSTPFIGTGSTITFAGTADHTLTGQTTFYGLRALGANTTIYFEAGATQYATNLVEFRNASLLSTAVGQPWFFSYTGSSQTLVGLRVRDSNASPDGGLLMVTDGTSRNYGNNVNWVFSQTADTGVRYWVAPSFGLWTSTGNWSNSSGGNPGAQVPLATHTVVFDGLSVSSASITTNITMSSLTISGFSGQINTNGYNFIVSSNVTQTSGSLVFSTSQVTFNGDLLRTGGSFDAGVSTITISGSQNQTLTPNATAFANVLINKGGGTLTLSGALTVTGDWRNSTTPNIGAVSTVTFAGSAPQTLSGSTTFYGLRAITPSAPLIFSAGTTQYIANMLELRNISLRSSDNTTWYFAFNGSSQTLVGLDVKDSNANPGATLFPDSTSVDSGNNRNWAFGDRRYWIATSAANWNTTTSWSYSSGGKAGAPVPTSTHTVVFDGVAGTNGQANINLSLSISSLTIAGYSGIINTQGYNITIASNVTQVTGTITLTTNTFSLGGDMIRSGGSFNTGQSTFALTGPLNQSINHGNANLYTFSLNKTGGTVQLIQPLYLNGSLNLAGGTLDTGSNYAISVASYVTISAGTLQLNASTMTVQSDWTKTGGFFSAGTSTVSFIGGNAQILTSGGTDFYHLVSSKTAGTTLAVNGNLGVDGDLNFLNGTMNTQGFTITVASNVFLTNGTINMTTNTMFVGGNFTRTAATFNSVSSTVAFNGSIDQSINSNGLTFYHVQVNKSGGTTATLTSALTTNGDLKISAGTLDTGSNWSVTVASHVAITNTGAFNLNNSTMSLQRDWTNTSALVNPGLSTVTFIGGFAQNVTSSGDNFFDLQINKTLATTATLQDALDVDGAFTVTAGSVSTNGKLLTVAGNWDNSGTGTFSSMNSTVTFNGATSQTILGQTTFYSLRAINPGATLYFTAGSTANVTNILEFRDNNLRSTTNGLFWYLRMIGSSQSVVNVNVQDSNAYGGNTIVPLTSADSGNNRNWAFGDDRYWVASAPGNWNTPANWSRTSGGTGGASVPSSTHTVIFDGGPSNTLNGQANVNVLVNIASLTISGYSGTINTQGYNVTVTSNITQVSGTLTMTTNTLTLGGDFIRAGGTFNTAASTLTLNGSVNQTLNNGNASLFTLNVNKSNGSIATLIQSLNLNGNLAINNGTLDTTPSNWAINVTSFVNIVGGTLQLNASTMSVQRNWVKTGGFFSAGTSTVSFIGGNAQILTSGGTDFYHLVSSKTAGTTLAVNGNLGVDGDLNFLNGTMNTQGFTITVASNVFLTNGIINMTTNTFFVGGNFSRTATTFNANRSTVAFNGFVDQSINPNGLTFYTVNLNKSGGTTATLVSPLTTNGDLAISAGTLDTGSNWSVTVASFVAITNTGAFNLNNSTMSLQRNWTNTSALVNPGFSTVTLLGGFAQNVTSSGDNFFNLQINKTANTVATLQDTLDVDGAFTLTAGTINANGKLLTVVGNWDNSAAGIFTAANSTVSFNGNTTQTILGQTTFYSLRAITNGSTLYFTAGSTNHVTGIVEFRDVSLRSTTDNATWYFKFTGSSQTIADVAVQDSNALFGTTLLPDITSTDLGNNRNWAFGGRSARYWISAGAANWNTTAPWSYVSGGTGGAPIPASTDTVVFDGGPTNTLNGQANITTTVNIASLTVSGYAGLINSQGYNITVTSNVTQTSGTLTLTTNTFSLGGDLLRSGGTFNTAASTLAVIGSIDQTVTLGNATLFNFHVTKNSGITTLTQTLNLNGSLRVSGGTLDTSLSNWAVNVTSHVTLTGGVLQLNGSTMSVQRDWTNTGGTFSAGTSTVSFIGGNAQILTSGGTDFYHLVSSKTAGTTLAVNGNLGVDGDLNFLNGTMNTQGFSITVASNVFLTNGIINMTTNTFFVGGNFSRAATTFNANRSTVAFNGFVDQSINPNGLTFYTVNLNKSGGTTATLVSPLTTNGDLAISAGTLDTGSNWSVTVASFVAITNTGAFNLNNSTMSLQRDWTNTSALVNPGLSTVTFIGGFAQSITSNGDNFFNFQINKTANTVATLQDTLDVDGAFTLTAGTINANGKLLTVVGNWDNSAAGIFTAANSTVTFNGATTQTILGQTTFYSLRAINPGSTIYFTAGSTNHVTGILELRDIGLQSTLNNATWYFKFTGSSQTIADVAVQDSNALFGTTLLPDITSTDLGNNRNWAFGGRSARYWISAGAANWNTTAPWSYVSGGTGGAPIPVSTDTVVFDGGPTNTLNGQANITTTISVASMTVAGYTGTINTQGYNITVTSNVTQVSGIITLTTNTLTLGGDLIRSGGTFNAAASTVALNGTLNQSINVGNAALFTLNVNKANGTVASLVQTLNLNGNLTVNNGTLDTTSSNWAVNVTSHVTLTGGVLQLNGSTMSVQRNWTNTGGTFSAGTSTVSFIGGNAQILTSGGTDFYHLVSSKTAGTTLAVNGNLGVDGDLTFLNGTMNTQGFTITVASNVFLTNGTINMTTNTMFVGGNFTRTAATFNSIQSTVSFNGSVAQSINPNGIAFYTVNVNKSGGTAATLASPLTTNGDLTISAGTLDTGSNWSVTVASHVSISNTGAFNLNNSTMSLQRDWTNTSAVVNPGFSTVTFIGGFAQNITSSGDNFFNLQINKNANTVATLQDAFDADGIFTIAGGTINTNGKALTIGGNWTNSLGATYTGTNSTVTFNSATSQTLLGQTTFYSLRAITNGSTLYFTAGSTNHVTGIVEFRDVYLRSTTNNATWYFKYTGSSQTIVDVTVQDSNANFGSALFPDSQSRDAGNNRNWAFAGSNVRYWVNSGGGLWTSAANWSYASGSLGGAPVPTSTDTVVFDGGGGFNGQANITTNINIASFTVSGYSGLINTQGYAITVASNVTQVSGTITLTTNTFSIGGDFIRTGGTFNAAASTVAFTGSQNQSIHTGGAIVANVFVNKTGGTATLASMLNSTGNFTLNGGTFDTGNNWSVTVTSHVILTGGTFNLNNSTMSVARDWIESGSANVVPGGSTVTFTNGNNQNITSNADNFFNLTISKTGGTLTLQDALTVDGTFNLAGSTITTNAKAISVGGDWRFPSGSFTGTGSTVTFNAPTQSTLSGSTTFYALRATTPNTTLYFTAGTTQYVTSLLDFENISLRSTSNNATWYFRYAGSSQTILNVTAQDSNASSGAVMQTFYPSVDGGNNRNWDFGAPTAISDLTAVPSGTGSSIDLTWTAPGEDGSLGTLINSTFTIQYSTDSSFANGGSWSPTSDPFPYVYRTIIATTNVAASSVQHRTITGLISGGTYYFRAWTKDIHGNTSAISNGATTYAQSLNLSIQLSTDTLALTGTINLNTTLVISTGIVVTNNGNVNETFEFHATTATAGTPWQMAASTSTDHFVLWAIVNDTEPISTDFAVDDKLNSASYTRCTSSQITNAATTCVDVPPGGTRTIWFKLAMPNLTTTGNAQQIRITGKATVPD